MSQLIADPGGIIMRRFLLLLVGVLVLASIQSATATATQATPVAQAVDEGTTFIPVTPLRVLDTRTGLGIGGGEPGAVEHFLPLDLRLQVPTSATAVVLNLTGTQPTAATYVAAVEGGWGRPDFSHLNLAAGETRANLVTVTLSPEQKIEFYNHAGAVHLIADLAGYYTTDNASRFTSMPPARTLDTRAGAPVGPGSTVEVDLSGRVPASATAVTFNLTATGSTASTHVTAYPTGAAPPTVSNLNLLPGQTIPNLVTVALGADRRITLFNNAGSVHLIADVAGYYASDRGDRYFPMRPPLRVTDTRDDGGPVGAGRTRDVDLSTRIAATATTAVVNLTGAGPTTDTFVTAYPAGTTRPIASNLNLVAGRDTANSAVVALGGNARFTLYNHAGSTDLVVDLFGFFATPPSCVSDCLYAWGGDLRYGTTPRRQSWLSGVTSVAAGDSSAYALRVDGTVWAWGDNQLGQLGHGETGGSSMVPLQVTGLNDVTAVAAGAWSGYALRADGTVWAWGRGENGALGWEYVIDSNVPVRVYGLTGVTAIAASNSHGYALRSDGTVWAWGSDSWGGLGGGSCPPGQSCPSFTPVRVALPQPGTTRYTAIAAGMLTGYALRSDGTVWAWGRNWAGETGTGSPLGTPVSPAQVVGLTDAVTIAAGTLNGYAVTSGGTVWSWGHDYWGELGTGAPQCVDPSYGCPSSVPVRVSGLTGPVTIDSSGGTTLAVRRDGTVWAWGRNADAGNLGNGTAGSCDGPLPLTEPCRTSTPRRSTITGVSAIASGGLGQFAVVPGT